MRERGGTDRERHTGRQRKRVTGTERHADRVRGREREPDRQRIRNIQQR